MNDHINPGWPLPPDLEFIIIDHFIDDKATLASCSLVCSQWLPHSRKHLFKDVTVMPIHHPTPDPLADFLHVVELSGAANSEWAIGPHVKKFTLAGRRNAWVLDRGTPTAPCFLSVLRTLLATLPHLVSLYVIKCLILDHTSQEPNVEPCLRPRFKLDELAIFGCSGLTEDPHHLLNLICTFSSIGSLSVYRWGRRRGGPLPTSSPPPFSPPTVRSLAVERVEDVVASRALYALLASVPSVTNTFLTRISVHATEWEDVRMFVSFANLVGAALRDVELYIDPDIRLDLLHDMTLTNSPVLTSLTLSIECPFRSWGLSGNDEANNIRKALHEHMQILSAHLTAFPALTTVRLDMQPSVRETLYAFVRVTQDIRRVWREDTMRPVEPHEAVQNSEVWAMLERVLCRFPALERVEFVLWESQTRAGEALTEEAKVALKGALEGRLPRLGRSGIAQIVFESFV